MYKNLPSMSSSWYRQVPPKYDVFSKQMGSTPSSLRLLTLQIPQTPPPITATLLTGISVHIMKEPENRIQLNVSIYFDRRPQQTNSLAPIIVFI